MSAYRNESVHESSFGGLIMILIGLFLMPWIGASMVRYMYDTEIMFYEKKIYGCLQRMYFRTT